MNIIDNYSLLTPAQTQLLHQCSKLPFILDKFTSLDDILTQLKVDVFIEPGIHVRTVPDYLEEADKFWREMLEHLRNQEYKDDKRIQEACNIIDIIGSEKSRFSLMPLRGLYDPKKRVIKLFPDEMQQEYDGKKMDELLVSTLAHETMHAYFDRPRHRSYPYVHFVEEPLAEFGMLLYLHETGSSYYKWAYNDVRRKNTCYRFGANLMDKYLHEGTTSPTRQYLEAYKIMIDRFAMPSVNNNGDIILPQKGGAPIVVNGHHVSPRWQDLFKYPPRYFYDPTTKTLGLDGCWGHELKSTPFYFDVRIMGHIMRHDIDNIYLGDNFYIGDYYDLDEYISKTPVIVSSKNKTFTAKDGKAKDGSIIKGIPLYKRNMSPVLSSRGKGYYKLYRNGKWGIIDAQLNQITPFKYDWIWSLDKNDLFLVRIFNGKKHLYGLVNKKGSEQVHVIYEDIDENNDGTYTVKQNGIEFIIDRTGKRK